MLACLSRDAPFQGRAATMMGAGARRAAEPTRAADASAPVVSLRNLSKTYWSAGVPSVVAVDLSLDLPRGRAVALLGRNGAGKSSLLRLVSGAARPDKGQVVRRGRISWPVGFAGSFHPDLTGSENLRFVARLYGADPRALERWVGEFAQLGSHMQARFGSYSSGMRARLAFGASMGLPFDLYLVDEVTAVGDAAFRSVAEEMLRSRLTQAGAIVVSHSLQQLARLCDAGLVLDRGRLTWHDDVMDAIDHHRALLGVAA